MKTACIGKGVALALLAFSVSACSVAPAGGPSAGQILSDSENLSLTFHIEPVNLLSIDKISAWPGHGRLPPYLGWPQSSNIASSGTIAAGDKISISIWENSAEPLLTSPGGGNISLPLLTVPDGGEIFVPYVGTVKAMGLTTEQLRHRVQANYAQVIDEPQVHVSVDKGQSASAEVLNGFTRPGIVPLGESVTTISSIIAQAGGVATGITNPQIRLVRGTKRYGGSLSQLMAGPHLTATILPGDKIYIEDDLRSFMAFGSSDVETRMTFARDSLTAMEAVSLLGGIEDERANAKGVLVLRDYSSEDLSNLGPPKPKVVFTIDLTTADGLFAASAFPMQDKDLLIVTETELTRASSVLAILGQITGIGTRF